MAMVASAIAERSECFISPRTQRGLVASLSEDEFCDRPGPKQFYIADRAQPTYPRDAMSKFSRSQHCKRAEKKDKFELGSRPRYQCSESRNEYDKTAETIVNRSINHRYLIAVFNEEDIGYEESLEILREKWFVHSTKNRSFNPVIADQFVTSVQSSEAGAEKS